VPTDISFYTSIFRFLQNSNSNANTHLEVDIYPPKFPWEHGIRLSTKRDALLFKDGSNYFPTKQKGGNI